MRRALSRKTLIAATDLASPLVSNKTRDAIADWLAKFLKNRIVTYRELANRDDVRIWWFGSNEEYEFGPPQYFDELPEEIDRLIGSHRCRSPFVMEVPDIILKGPHGFKITQDGRYIVFNFWRDSNRTYAARSLAYDFLLGLGEGALPEFTPELGDDIPQVDTVVSLLTKHATNYTHWKQDCLALLEGVEEYRSQTGRDPKVMIPPDPPSFILESLETLGYTDDQYIEMDHERVKVRRLVLPSVRRCLSETSDDYFRMISGLRWVRDRALENVSPPKDGEYSSKILISREDAKTRRLVNREEVATRLSGIGFESYVLSELNYRNQVRLFSQADFIVGAHGAGMINSIYATDAGLIELYGAHYLPANFELSQGLGLKYGCLKCDSVNDDIRVNVDELVEAIDVLKNA